MIAALSRVVLAGGSRVLPSVDLAPDADPRSRLPRALTLLAAVEIPVVLAGAVGQALPLGYRDVVALVVIFAITVAVLTLVPWRRIGEGWLLVSLPGYLAHRWWVTRDERAAREDRRRQALGHERRRAPPPLPGGQGHHHPGGTP